MARLDAKNPSDNQKGKNGRLDWLVGVLLWLLFIVFFLATIVTMFYYLVVPTPNELPGTFPDVSSETLWWAIKRHVSLFPEHFTSLARLDLINYAFLTMFVRKIKKDFDDGEGGKISTYIKWAIGSLLSGIIFTVSRLNDTSTPFHMMVIYTALIIVFASLSYLLYLLSVKVRNEELR